MNFWLLMKAFERAGFRYYEFGKLKRGRKVIADYYKGDPLNDEVKRILKAEIPAVEFLGAAPMYAPEMRAGLVVIPRGKAKGGAQ